jgi:hypothetical protein
MEKEKSVHDVLITKLLLENWRTKTFFHEKFYAPTLVQDLLVERIYLCKSHTNITRNQLYECATMKFTNA